MKAPFMMPENVFEKLPSHIQSAVTKKGTKIIKPSHGKTTGKFQVTYPEKTFTEKKPLKKPKKVKWFPKPPSPISFIFPPLGFLESPVEGGPPAGANLIPPIAPPVTAPELPSLPTPSLPKLPDIGKSISDIGKGISESIGKFGSWLPMVLVLIVAVLLLKK